MDASCDITTEIRPLYGRSGTIRPVRTVNQLTENPSFDEGIMVRVPSSAPVPMAQIVWVLCLAGSVVRLTIFANRPSAAFSAPARLLTGRQRNVREADFLGCVGSSLAFGSQPFGATPT